MGNNSKALLPVLPDEGMSLAKDILAKAQRDEDDNGWRQVETEIGRSYWENVG
jgi:hypothetical protein